MAIQSIDHSEATNPSPSNDDCVQPVLPLAATLDDELWRRAEARREASMLTEATDEERLLMPLALSLARLLAQRDARARG
ncbi:MULTISPECIES: hypothetical protein [unclassified Brevundimonas]|uniref:hypothetical protein n=1 Tax=unclassified Brevundimonas TaxID=2622653 RepID=UPI000E88B03E|nr:MULTISPECIES: hypothetical protein [unclassified Brevundimonas]HBY44472.1 hypothetical protein [Brevundimonas sp.]